MPRRPPTGGGKLRNLGRPLTDEEKISVARSQEELIMAYTKRKKKNG
jgi:hypothetical protein